MFLSFFVFVFYVYMVSFMFIYSFQQFCWVFVIFLNVYFSWILFISFSNFATLFNAAYEIIKNMKHQHTFVYPYLCRNKHFMNCNSLHEAPEDTRNSLTSHTRLCLQGRPCKERWRRDGEMNVCSPAGECGGNDGNDGQLGDQEVSTWVSLALCAVHIDTIKPPQSLELKTQLLACYACHFCGKQNCKNILIFIFSQNSLWCRWLWRRCFEVARVCWVMFILLPAIADICVWLCIRIKLL